MSARPKLLLEYVSPWIDADIQKPDDGQTVLCYWPKSGIAVMHSMESLTFHACDSEVDGSESWTDWEGEKSDAPTHWQPMLETP